MSPIEQQYAGGGSGTGGSAVRHKRHSRQGSTQTNFNRNAAEGFDGGWEGIRVFDISDVTNPVQVATVQTCRGSHTHSLLADPDPAKAQRTMQAMLTMTRIDLEALRRAHAGS